MSGNPRFMLTVTDASSTGMKAQKIAFFIDGPRYLTCKF
jgi:hypothetical protein